MESSDRIEKSVVLKASRARVWRAISDFEELGRWFGMYIEGPLVAGESVSCRIRPTEVDADIAAAQAAFEGAPFTLDVVAVEPMSRLAFRWHPGVDAEDEPDDEKTLVELTLSDAPEGTRLDIVESGFDRVPLERRAKAFEMNEGGWEAQTQLVRKFVEGDC